MLSGNRRLSILGGLAYTAHPFLFEGKHSDQATLREYA